MCKTCEASLFCFFNQKTFFHLHWHAIVKLLYGLVVDCDGHLCICIEYKLDIVAGSVFSRCFITW